MSDRGGNLEDGSRSPRHQGVRGTTAEIDSGRLAGEKPRFSSDLDKLGGIKGAKDPSKNGTGKPGKNAEAAGFTMTNSRMNDFHDSSMTDQDLYDYGDEFEGRSDGGRDEYGDDPKPDDDESVEEEEIGLDDI